MEIGTKKFLGFSLLLGGIALCGVGPWLLLSPAQYRATATIMVDIDMPPIGGNRWASFDPYFIQTEFEVIQSVVVLSNVVSISNLNVFWGEKYNAGSPLKTAKTVELLKRRMSLFPIRNTKFIEITFRSENSDEVARIANAIAKAYQEYCMNLQKQNVVTELEVLQQEYLAEEPDIQIRQTNQDLLRKKLKIQDDDLLSQEPPTTGSLLFNSGDTNNAGFLKSQELEQRPYWEEKHKLEGMIYLHKLLQAKITELTLEVATPKFAPVEIIDAAQPPKSPAGPNRLLGAALLAIGLFPAAGGFLMFKSARHPVQM